MPCFDSPSTLRIAPRRRGTAGGALLLFTLMLPTVLLPMVGLAIDGVALFLVKAKLSAAVDGGAIAAARSLSAGLSFAAQRDAATRTAGQFVHANFPDGYWGSRNLVFDPPIDVQEDTSASIKRRTVEISAAVDVPLLFMRLLGRQTATVRAYGKAARRDVRLVLVLDRSTSMSGVIGDLKNAAVDFVNRFAEGRDQVGLVVFGGSAIVAFPPRDPANPSAGTGPASNFKTASPSVTTLINAINYGSNTGTAEALWLAYQELKKSPLPGALNLIVLFTDGLPNGITAYFNDIDMTRNVISATSSCTYRQAAINPITSTVIPNTRMIGFISQQSGFAMSGTVAGVFQLMNLTQDATHPDVKSWMSKAAEGTIPPPACDKCAYTDDRNNMPQDIRAIPAVDYYGNRTDGTTYQQSTLYKTQHVALDMSKRDSPYHIGLASWNATDDAARRIRADSAITPVIYTIGYSGGSEKPDPVLMQRVANVNTPDNTAYDPSLPTGLYVMAPTTAQLAAAFGKVASEILRLTN
jgi:Flp pilus assembly protein TadG